MKALILAIFSLLLGSPAFAYYTVQDTGELIPEGFYTAGAELQFMTSPDSGANAIGRFDGSFKDDFNYRGYVGFGKIDFEIGGQVKWVPFPDVGRQPAIGFVAGAMVATYEDNTEFSIRTYPIVSKTFDIQERGVVTPYAALPLTFRNYDDDSDTPLQFVIGSKYIHPDYQGIHAYAELGLKLDDSIAYVSIGATFPMNEDNKFDLQPDQTEYQDQDEMELVPLSQ